MNREAEGLSALRAQMSAKQRAEMSDIVRAEMVRRGLMEDTPKKSKKSGPRPAGISGGLGSEQLREMYADLADRDRRGTLLAGTTRSRSESVLEGFSSIDRKLAAKVALVGVIAVLGIVKVASRPRTGEPKMNVVAAVERAEATVSRPLPGPDARGSLRQAPGGVRDDEMPSLPSVGGTSLSDDLDARRVELEKRRELLERKEEDLRAQEQLLNERLAELRTLSQQLGDVRKGDASEKNSRLEQLASVYGAMAPNEAASILSRLDPGIALQLLERMPEKRLGQILGLMDHERAVELTRALTDRR